MKLTRDHAILFVILFLSLFLRIYNLGSESIWIDEGFSIKSAHLTLPQIIKQASQLVENPPLYYFILHFWIKIFGASEFSARFPSVIFGFFTVFMCYKIGKSLFNKEAGLLSALLVGLSSFHIHYSQEVRAYSLLAFLTSLSMFFFIRILRENSPAVSSGYVLSTILLMYTHNFSLLIIMAQNIFFLMFYFLSGKNFECRIKKWIFLQIILLIVFTPFIRILITQISSLGSDFWIPRPSIFSIFQTFWHYTGGQYLYAPQWVDAPILLFFFFLLALSTIPRKSEIHKTSLLFLWLLIPIILPFVISLIFRPSYVVRYTIGASLAFYLLVARGILNIPSRRVRIIIICIIMIFSSISIRSYYYKYHKEPWREAVAFIDAHAEPGDLLLFNPGYCRAQCFDYYSDREDIIKKSFPKHTDRVDKTNIKELDPTVITHNNVWIILSHSLDKDGLITKRLKKSYGLSLHKEYKNIDIYLFELKKNEGDSMIFREF